MDFNFIIKNIHVDIKDGCIKALSWIDGNESIKESTNILFQKTISQLKEYFNGMRYEFSIPIIYSGTIFQQRVWQELQKIPYGNTISYKELAMKTGNPKAVRAVAQACGANPIPIIIPCHRVICTNGKIGGYSAGLDIKRLLLELEYNNTNNHHRNLFSF